MKQILLSIKKEFCRKILTGEKTLELRKTFPDEFFRPYPLIVFMYESGKDGERKIVGKFELLHGYQIGRKLDSLKAKNLAERACVTVQDFSNYMPGYAWQVTRPKKLKTAVELSVIGLTRPPQSWQYLNNEQVAVLERKLK